MRLGRMALTALLVLGALAFGTPLLVQTALGQIRSILEQIPTYPVLRRDKPRSKSIGLFKVLGSMATQDPRPVKRAPKTQLLWFCYILTLICYLGGQISSFVAFRVQSIT